MRSRFSIQSVAVHSVVVAVFGVVLPWMRGIDFLDSVMLCAYACLGVVFAAPAAAQAFAADRVQTMPDAAARIVMSVVYGELMAALILLAGIMTVYMSHRVVFPPDWETLVKAAGLGVAASTAMAAVSGWVTVTFSPAAARAAMRAIFIVLLVLFFYKSRWLPDVLGLASAISLAAVAAAFLGIRLSVRSKSV